jgi:hypothetical protein
MNFSTGSSAFHRRLVRFTNLPVAGLIALLQRTPIVQVAASAEEFVLASPIGAVLRSTVAAAAALGAVHSMAGATALVAADTSGAVDSPLQASAGTAIPTIVFTIIGTQEQGSTSTVPIPGSWSLSGNLPPGLSFNGLNSAQWAEAPGFANASGPSSGALTGTPTAAGSYTMMLTAYEFAGGAAANGTSAMYNGVSGPFISGTFPFTIIVTGSVSAPTFSTNPQPTTVTVGQNVILTAAASGSPTYQWDFNNAPLSDTGNITGATGPTLTITSATLAESGSYTCVATNSAGPSTSSAAIVTVNPVSAPAITVNPQPQAMNSGSTVVFTAAASGAITYQWTFNNAPLPDSVSGITSDVVSGSTGPQLVITNVTGLSAGNYALMATNSIGSTSSTVAQLQVASSSNPGLATSISTRAFVGTGDNILIGGFYIVGSTSRTVLVQAIGPGLAPLGVTGVLAHPDLSIHQNQSGHDVTLYSNIGWSTNTGAAEQQVLLAAAASVFASPTLVAGAADSELLLTLPPGGYSAEVSGADGGTGVALCAIYELP